jgi:hypothetical protein
MQVIRERVELEGRVLDCGASDTRIHGWLRNRYERHGSDRSRADGV